MIKLSGKINRIFDSQTFETFEKRIFWMEDNFNENYPNIFALELWNKDCKMIDNYSVGDYITAYIDVKGKHWQRDGKEGVMNTLKCWNIEKEGVLFKPIKQS